MEGDHGKSVHDFLNWSHKGSLVHEHSILDEQKLRKAAEEILVAIEETAPREQKIERIVRGIGAYYFMGARAEAVELDQAIDRLDAEHRPSYVEYFPSLIDTALKYLRESTRADPAHAARMSKAEDGLRGSALRFCEAWNDRGHRSKNSPKK